MFNFVDSAVSNNMKRLASYYVPKDHYQAIIEGQQVAALSVVSALAVAAILMLSMVGLYMHLASQGYVSSSMLTNRFILDTKIILGTCGVWTALSLIAFSVLSILRSRAHNELREQENFEPLLPGSAQNGTSFTPVPLEDDTSSCVPLDD